MVAVIDYGLRRGEDGKVNALPGDAVEVWNGINWVGDYLIFKVLDDRITVIKEGWRTDHYFPEHIRHAPGGAGWYRLREERLREALEAIISVVVPAERYGRNTHDALLDLDVYTELLRIARDALESAATDNAA